jgi:hypothetical protein
VRLVEVLEGRTRTIAGVGSSGECFRRTVGTSTEVEPDDAVEASVEQIGVWALGDHREERLVGELVGLLFRVGDHRDVRIHDGPADWYPGTAFAPPSVGAYFCLRVQLEERERGTELGLRGSFAERDDEVLEPALSRSLVVARIYLVSAIHERLLLGVESVRLAL